MDIEQTLRLACEPREPAAEFEDALMARVTAAAWRASRDAKRKPRRLILIGTILALSAAAALLVSNLRGTVPPQQLAAESAPAPVAQPPVQADVKPPATATHVAQPPEPESSVQVLLPAKPFTVRAPLHNEAKDEPARSAVNAFHLATLDLLRTIPGLILVESDADPNVTTEYRVTLTAQDGGPGNIQVGVQSDVRLPDGRSRRNMIYPIQGQITRCAAVTTDDGSCMDPAGLAAFMVRQLRVFVFPRDATLRQQLQARLLDRSAYPKQRLDALADLVNLNRERATLNGPPEAPVWPQADPALIRGIVDLAAAGDAAVRAQIWRSTREVRSNELIAPLTAAARDDADGSVRLEAAITLAGFAGVEHAHTALETIARQDSRPMVRAVAQQAVTSDPVWRDYVLASLKDEGRTDIERVEALAWSTFQGSPPGGPASSALFKFIALDDVATSALAQLLPKLRASGAMPGYQLDELERSVAKIKHPAGNQLPFDSLAGDGGQVDRGTGIDMRAIVERLLERILERGGDSRIESALAQSRDPGMRAALEQISGTDPDPKRREAAARVLKLQAVENP